MNEVFVHPDIREKVVQDLTARRKNKIQRDDVKIHGHQKGEPCTDDCFIWKCEEEEIVALDNGDTFTVDPDRCIECGSRKEVEMVTFGDRKLPVCLTCRRENGLDR